MARIYLHKSVVSCPFMNGDDITSIICWNSTAISNYPLADVCMGGKNKCNFIDINLR